MSEPTVAFDTNVGEIYFEYERQDGSRFLSIIGWDEWYAGNLSYYLGGTKRPKVLMKDFTKAIAFKKENNFVLITKDLTANKVCSLTNKQTTKKEPLGSLLA